MSALTYKTSSLVIGCILLLAVSCKKKLSPQQTQDNLKRAWLTFLQNGPHFDSTRAKFEITKVTYFEDSAFYVCEFKVRLKIPSQGIDTLGIMNGTISKDFSDVHRKY
jgi:hypothetical protein